MKESILMIGASLFKILMYLWASQSLASTLGLNLFAVIDQQWNKKPGGYQKVILIGRLTTLE